MNLRRASTTLSILGGALLVVAAAILVSIGWGEISSVSTSSDGQTVVTETHRTASVAQDSLGVALAWVGVAAVVAVAFALLIRYGGIVGPVVVLVLTGLAVLASIMSIGIFLAPGAGLLVASAALALAGRAEDHQLGGFPPPPPPPATADRRPAGTDHPG